MNGRPSFSPLTSDKLGHFLLSELKDHFSTQGECGGSFFSIDESPFPYFSQSLPDAALNLTVPPGPNFFARFAH